MANKQQTSSAKQGNQCMHNGQSPTGQHDGRQIHPDLGSLSGEGATQEHQRAQTTKDLHTVWQQTATATQQGDETTYYDRPVIKESVWIWTIPLYFFLGGAAGAAALLGAVAQLFGGSRLQGLVTRCRWISAVATNVGAIFLITDLGRPERFLNMLRVFRPTSPMSVGSWIVAGSGGFTAAAALFDQVRGGLGWLGNAAGALSGLFGIGLAGYTGVLLGNTVVPLWLATCRSLPVLFISSGMASAAAILHLTKLNDREYKVVHRFGLVGQVAELVTAKVMEREAGRVEQVGKPLHEGRGGLLWKGGEVLGILGLLFAFLPRRWRFWQMVGALCTIAGSLSTRYALLEAGNASARDPRATFQQQRARLTQCSTKRDAEEQFRRLV